MSERTPTADVGYKGLLVVAAAAALLAGLAVVHAVTNLVTPLEDVTSIRVVEQPRPGVRQRVHQQTPTQPWTPSVSGGDPKPRAAGETHAPDFKFAGIASEQNGIHARQMAALREDIVNNADDDQEGLPNAAQIAELEQKGVMVW